MIIFGAQVEHLQQTTFPDQGIRKGMDSSKKPRQKRASNDRSGKLRIGDQWNAINIIALSQSNPLKAVAEFVENAIDARASNVTIVRGKERGSFYLKISDDGEGIPRSDDGTPDFRYVATHICDSIKKRLKNDGATGIQGEFGIGLLSFWTVGEEMTMVSAGADGGVYQMRMRKGSPDYEVTRLRVLIPPEGTQLTIRPLLTGTRQLTGERIQRYLAAELRDRIRSSGVEIKVVDRTSRAEYRVEPRQFSGRLLHDLPTPDTADAEVYFELYLNEKSDDNQVAVHRKGTRVIADITQLEGFEGDPWSSRCLQGIVDASLLNLTPGTRQGVIHDAAYERFRQALAPVETRLKGILDEQRRAEEESANRGILRSVQRAFREALIALPREEYDWFDVYARRPSAPGPGRGETDQPPLAVQDAGDGGSERMPSEAAEPGSTKEFFEFPGPLHGVLISPRSCVLPVGQSRNLRAICRDKARRLVEADLFFRWEIVDGGGSLDGHDEEIVTFTAADEPGLTILKLSLRQVEGIECEAEAMITVAESLIPEVADNRGPRKGLPGYTFRRAPGETWRSIYDVEQNLVVINNGHRDFVYASRHKPRQLRYICRLFSKELVLHNFPGLSPAALLERMVELSVYTEENLK